VTPVPGKRDLLGFSGLTADDLSALILRAEEFRFLRSVRAPHATRPGRVLGMIFEKASTRTRASFEIAVYELGGHGVVLGRADSQVGRGEPMRDTARVLSGYCHAIMIRTFGQDRAEELARFATVPAINGLTDLLHPCQVLADLQTAYAHFALPAGHARAADEGEILRGVRYAWIGDGNNMANSWIEAAAVLGLDLAIACPAGYDPDAGVLDWARRSGRGRIEVTRDVRAAVAGRKVLSTDVFTSMGQEAETQQRLRDFAGYCLDGALLGAADPAAIVLHCLPAHRGEEISDEVLEGPQSVIWRQAENRLHAQKAVLEWVMA
jgi:ornithine carbamoyltransferase